MCELLGMSANTPTDICFSFTGLMQRGGKTGPHSDGWGIAFYEQKRCQIFHDPHPSHSSPIAQLIHQYPIKSHTVISHIRQATHGKVCLANTHPFTRELGGVMWCFAHNGKLPGVKKRSLVYYKPIGTTDSEHAFCWIMDQIRMRWSSGRPTNKRTLARFLQKLARELATHGTFNMLLSNSKLLFAFCTTHLHWKTRRAPFEKVSLIDAELTVNFKEETSPHDVVTVVATHPLTHHEVWTALEKKTLYLFDQGEVCTLEDL